MTTNYTTSTNVLNNQKMFNLLPYSTQHGASLNAGTNSVQIPNGVSELFSGSNSAHKIQEFKNQIIALLRYNGLERWLGEPVEDLLPDKKKYNEMDMADLRKFDEDTEKIYLQAAKAYALVRGRFKPNSEAESVIRPADDQGRLDVLWDLFCRHYDNPITKSGAAKLIQSWYTVDPQMDILALYMFFTEHFTKIETVPEKINKGVFISGVTSPLKKFVMRTPAETASSEQSVASNSPANKFAVPSWAKSLHALYRIAEIPRHKDLINKFIFDHIITATNQDLNELQVEGILELLKVFLQNQSSIKRDKVATSYSTETSFFCSFHGSNASHATRDCVRLKKQRQGNNFNYYRTNEKHKNYRDRRTASSYGRSRSNSFGRENRGRDREYRGSSPYPRREIKDNDQTNTNTPRLNNYLAITDMPSTTTSKETPNDILYGKRAYESAVSPRYQSGSDTELETHNVDMVIQLGLEDPHEDVLQTPRQIIADSGATSVIINRENENFVSEKQPAEGTILGASGRQIGVITHKGVIHIMGVPVQCYVANIHKSVIGLGYISEHYGFQISIRGDIMTIRSQLSGLCARIANRGNLFRLPPLLFESRDERRFSSAQERMEDETPDLIMYDDFPPFELGLYPFGEDIFPDDDLENYAIELHTNINIYKGEDTGAAQILADSGANHIIFNTENLHLVTDTEPVTGSIIGAAGKTLGLVTHRGKTEFMGVSMKCYVADISKSVVGLGYIAKYYGFFIQIDNGHMNIYSKRSGQGISIAANNNHLFTLPESLFQSITINAMMTSLRPDSLHSLWHHRLGHLDDRKLAHMLKIENYKKRGLVMHENPMKVHNEQYCDCCAQTKGQKIRSTKIVDKDATEKGLSWHMDLPGKNKTPAIVTGNRSRVIFTDRKTRYRYYIGITDNSEEEIKTAIYAWHTKCILLVKGWYKDRYDTVPISLLADNLEAAYSESQDLLRSLGVMPTFTSAEHSSSNGLAERGIGIIRTIDRSLRKSKHLPDEFWEVSERHGCFIANRIPFMYRGEYQTDPYQLWTGRIFDYSKIRIFGSRCYTYKMQNKDDTVRALPGIYVGHVEDSNAYIVYLPQKNEFTASENVRFYEQAEDIFSTQRTPEETDSLQQALNRIANFLQSETTQI